MDLSFHTIGVIVMDFGKVVNTQKLVRADGPHGIPAVKCMCMTQTKPPVNNVPCEKGASEKTIVYEPFEKTLSKKRNCKEPVWVFPEDTFPPKDTDSPGSCDALFREECAPPEYLYRRDVMCAGNQTAAFDAYSAARQVREELINVI